jgi:anthranilate synthase component I
MTMKLNQYPNETTFCKLAEKSNVIPVCIEILADTETPVSVIGKLHRPQHPLFLFESVEGGERWGRYSFAGISAQSHIRVFADVVKIETAESQEVIPHKGNPLVVLKNLMAQYRPADIPELPRFWGGLVGYFTYEMVSFFESIPNTLPTDKPIANFIIPSEVLIFDNIRHTLTAVALCFVSDGTTPSELYKNALSQLETIFKALSTSTFETVTAPHSCQLAPMKDEASYHDNVNRVKEYILAGDVIQTVISQEFSCPSPPSFLDVYRAQRYINPSPYLFLLHLDGMTLAGSSPETMVRLENSIATLRPIAGTRPRGKTEQEDRALANELLSDEKERAEHLMLVDLGRNDLGRIAEVGSVQVTDLMVVERYSHVMHLVSNIVCDLNSDCDAWDLLAATFPAGTLSGAPKIRAMEIIAELEETPRGPYGGAAGYISFDGNMDMAIVIRTAVIEDGKLTVRAGAGIVADSTPENEQMETINKAMGIQKALQLLKQATS